MLRALEGAQDAAAWRAASVSPGYLYNGDEDALAQLAAVSSWSRIRCVWSARAIYRNPSSCLPTRVGMGECGSALQAAAKGTTASHG